MRSRNELVHILTRILAAALPVFVAPASAQTFAPYRESIAAPWTIADDDFARHRDPAEWRVLAVQRISFVEDGASWHVFRIANTITPQGPLWMVLHDNENATFDAGLEALRSWGGVMMVVDTDPLGTSYAARFNRAVNYGEPIDPNRNFRETTPLYTATLLADLGSRPIVALHTNAYGYDRTLSDCGGSSDTGRGDTGSGEISVLLCDARHSPRPAIVPRWPFDDADTLALVPYLRGSDARASFCGKRLVARDFNMVFEGVDLTDGSLSNYATLHGRRYVNLETRERGYDPVDIAAARDRLVTMIDTVMRECVAIPAVSIDPRTPPPPPPGKVRRRRR